MEQHILVLYISSLLSATTKDRSGGYNEVYGGWGGEIEGMETDDAAHSFFYLFLLSHNEGSKCLKFKTGIRDFHFILRSVDGCRNSK